MSTCKEEYRNIIAVTNRKLSSRPFLEQMERVSRLQPKEVILREKDLQEEMYEELAVKVIELCKQYQVPCMLHTYLETAEKTAASIYPSSPVSVQRKQRETE